MTPDSGAQAAEPASPGFGIFSLPPTWEQCAEHLYMLMVHMAECQYKEIKIRSAAFLNAAATTDKQREHAANLKAADVRLAYDIAAAELAAYHVLIDGLTSGLMDLPGKDRS